MFWIRQVLVRIIDTRLWHRFGTSYLIRHSTACESSAADLDKKLGGESKLAYNSERDDPPLPPNRGARRFTPSFQAPNWRLVSAALFGWSHCSPGTPVSPCMHGT